MKTDAKRPILECRQVSKRFTNNGETFDILRDVSFCAEENQVTVITGKSGEGKTVLLWLLAALDAPTAGEVLFEGEDLGGLTENALARLRRNKLCLIFQDFNLVASYTALENVMAPLVESGVPKTEQRERAAAVLRSLGLGRRLHNLPAELSIGQRQRVAVARTMIVSPRVILADEPTGGLDPETAAEIIELLVRQVRKTRACLIAATHGLFPLNVADRAYELKGGLLRPAKMNRG
jgi:putative ABC transport system ATP-binding protein